MLVGCIDTDIDKNPLLYHQPTEAVRIMNSSCLFYFLDYLSINLYRFFLSFVCRELQPKFSYTILCCIIDD